METISLEWNTAGAARTPEYQQSNSLCLWTLPSRADSGTWLHAVCWTAALCGIFRIIQLLFLWSNISSEWHKMKLI